MRVPFRLHFVTASTNQRNCELYTIAFGMGIDKLRALAERELIWSWCDGRKTVRNRKGTVFFGITAAGGRALGTSDIPIPPGPVEEEPDDDEDLPANEDLQVILMEMHGEFEVPSYDALVRMCGRYPQYAKQLTDDFLSSAVSCIQNDEPQRLVELTQEERLSDALDFRSRREKEFLLEIMERQGPAMPPPPVTSLDAFDRHVLEAVYQLGIARPHHVSTMVHRRRLVRENHHRRKMPSR